MWRHSVLWLALVVTLGCWTLTAAQDGDLYKPPSLVEPRTAKEVHVTNRGTQTLACSATGTPTPKYTWRYKGGNPLQPMDLPRTATFDEVSGALTVTDFTEREEGEYQCLAFSEIQPGKKITAVAPAYTLKIIVLDQWPVVTKTTTVRNEGEPASLTCERPPRSQPPATFKWFQQDKHGKEVQIDERIYIDNKGSLHYSYLKRTDTYDALQCALYNMQMQSINLGSPRQLEVLSGSLQESAPSILYFTKDATAMRIKDMELECVFSGYPIPSVSWFDPNNKPISTMDRYELHDQNRKLTIRQVQEDDQGLYRCRGSNSIGQLVQDVYLTVVSKPIPVQVFYDVTRPEFTNVMLPCKTRAAQGDSATISTPVWTKNGETFTADGVKYRYNSDKTELTIVNITKPADISCYRCETTNVHGDFSADGCLNVINPIRLTEVPPLEQRIKKGDTVHLTIRATTDVSMKSSLETRVTFKGVVYEYNRNQRPPFMTYDPLTQVAYINTGDLNDQNYKAVNGTYTLEVYHSYENKSVNVSVLLVDVEGIFGAATAGVGNLWWIALVIGILLLVIVIVVIGSVCWYRKMQEGVYPLDKTERAADLDPEKDLENAGFHDLSRAGDENAPSRAPPTSMLDDYVESDDEGSLVQYGDLDTGKFNEDGSFIGLYGSNKPEKQSGASESSI